MYHLIHSNNHISQISLSFRSTANAISNYSFDATSPTRGGGVGLAAMGGTAGGGFKLDLADGVATGNGTAVRMAHGSHVKLSQLKSSPDSQVRSSDSFTTGRPMSS